MKKTGILLSNLGTPEAPTSKAVRTYLREFLSDPYVINKPRWLWLPILYGIILNIRPQRSSKKYAKIWMKEGPPLLIFSQKITQKLKSALPHTVISLGMRYGTPSLSDAINELISAKVDNIILLPLYPQYSVSTTKSTLNAVTTLLKHTHIQLKTIESYYQNPLYIETLAQSIRDFWKTHGRAQKLIFSFHGLPQSTIKKGDPYFSQCQSTAHLLAQKLNLSETDYQLTFQSRIGIEKWLQPYTAQTIQSLPKQGIDHIQVVCPGFACDCLETLEEINIENQKLFLQAGGKNFAYIPCLNDSDAQINLLTNLLKS